MTKVVPNAKRHTITPMINKTIAKDTMIYTDEFSIYDHLAYIGFDHERINNRAKQYVRGKIHVNSIEGFWSQTKRGISGVHHSVSPKYLRSYLSPVLFERVCLSL